ncbi:MAG: hypothetical protein ACO3I1_08085 [Burkholderiales bacterium]
MAEVQNNEQLEFNVGEDEQEAIVELNDDGAAEVVAEKQEQPEKQAAPSSDDLDNYSEKVKKRIDKLTARLRESERREESALEYARSVHAKHTELSKAYEQSTTARRGEAEGRLDTTITALKNVIKRAREEGDIDTETEAQQRLTTSLWEKQQLLQQKNTPVQTPQNLQVPSFNQPPRVDAKAEEWAERNEWFGQDVVMTNTVRGIHVELVKNEGFDPSSDEYYDEIDRRMRNIFPQRFEVEEPAPQTTNRTSRPVQTVAPATRSSGVNSTARRTIKLRPSEVAIAKRLGVPLEEYAKYVKR